MECDVTVDSRRQSSSPYSVICPRCETVSSVEEAACPYCGADRHGAVMTRGADTAVRAVAAARGVTRQFHESAEPRRVRWLPRVGRAEPQLPAHAAANGAAVALDGPHRVSNSVWATTVMAGVVLCACFLARTYFEQHPATPRAQAVPVAAAGTIGQPAAKIEVAERIVESRPADVAQPPVNAPSPVIPVVASSNDSTPQVVIAESPTVKKNAASGARTSHRAVAKAAAASKTASASKPNVSKTAARSTQHLASKTERKQEAQTRKPPQHTELARTKPAAKEFQKVKAVSAPVKPAMTADGSWKPSRRE